VHDNFFELGGHSLLATKVVSRIRSELEVELPLRDLFDHQTVAKISDRLQALGESAARSGKPVLRPMDRSGDLPMAYTQESLWFLDQLETELPTYSAYPALRMTGPLDVAALEWTLSELVRRHESLRTRYPEVNGRPTQVIEPHEFRSLPVIDLSDLPAAEKDDSLDACIREEMERPVDLQNGPIIRMKLIRLAEQDHVALMATHHIIYDGWSLAVMAREISVLYRAFLAGAPSPLPELMIQYADFAHWQRAYLQGETLAQLKDYWVKQLDGTPPLELPTDFPRPALRTTRGDNRPCVLSRELSRAVVEFCRAEGVTPYMTLLAAFELLLSRYSGQRDFAVGSPVANRSEPGLENLIGYFINMLALRSDVAEGLTFRELAQRVRNTALGAFEHQELTLDQVVDALKLPRDVSRHPLFQVMFVLQNNETPNLDLPGLGIAPMLDIPTRATAFFELSLALTETDEGFQGGFNFNADLFSGETVERMDRSFQRLLAEALAAPDQPLHTLPVLSDAERRQIVHEWNPTSEVPCPDACVHHLFERRAGRSPAAVALVDGENSWTYGQLNDRANRFAHYLRDLGVGPDDVVAVRLPRSGDLIVALLGVLKAGGAYLPLDPKWPCDRLEFILADAAVDVLVTCESLTEDLPNGASHVVSLDAANAQVLASYPATNPAASAGPSNLAYVIYTSGSTGAPKGAMIEHAALANYVAGAVTDYKIGESDRVLQFASVSFDAHVEEVYPCLTQGGALVLRSEDMLDGFEKFLDRCRAWELTVLSLPTGFWRELTSAMQSTAIALPSSVRLVIIGGEEARPKDVARWFEAVGEGVRLLNTYGPTETTVVATAAKLTAAHGAAARVPIGRPLANMRAYVLDGALQPVPVGVHGELYIGGSSVGRGYLNRDDLTAERFVTDPFVGDPAARMYRTGDVARWNAGGQLEFIGRADRQVKIRGFRIEPGEVERALRECPSVEDAAVVPYERMPGVSQLVAYVVFCGGEAKASDSKPDGETAESAELAAVRSHLQRRLPEYMAPSFFVPLESFPRTTSGKVDLRALPAPAWDRSGVTGEYVAPRNPVEETLAAIWAETLRVEKVGVHDNFFELGGNSLLAVQVASRVRASFAIDLPLRDLFEAQTVAGLAARATALEQSANETADLGQSMMEHLLASATGVATEDGRSLVPLHTGGDAAPLFCIHGLGGGVASFLPLTDHLAAERPVYGLQPQGLQNDRQPHDRIEAMAAHYADEIRGVQPTGPYFLAGWSMGGLLALEIARQFTEAGERVEWVAMFDTHLPAEEPTDEAPDDRAILRYLQPFLGFSEEELDQASAQNLPAFLAEKIGLPAGLADGAIARLAGVCKAQLAALGRRRETPYRGPVALFSTNGAEDDVRWRQLFPRLTVKQVGGDHYSMLQPPHVETLATELKYLLQGGSSEALLDDPTNATSETP